jgi:hypothetical protein
MRIQMIIKLFGGILNNDEWVNVNYMCEVVAINDFDVISKL